MPGGQFSHFWDKISLARDTGYRGSILGQLASLFYRFYFMLHTVLSSLSLVGFSNSRLSYLPKIINIALNLPKLILKICWPLFLWTQRSVTRLHSWCTQTVTLKVLNSC